MRVQVRGILVLVWIVAILIVVFVWTCTALAGDGGGTTKKSEPIQAVEPEQHTEAVHTDLPGHDTEHVVWDWRHLETWKLVSGLGGAGLTLAAAIFGGVCAVKAARARKQQAL